MKRYLLDRDVMSQLDQPEENRHENVKAWLDDVPDSALFVSAITVMEAWKGFSRERKRSADDPGRLDECLRYEEAFAELIDAFSDRVVPVDEPVATFGAKCWVGERSTHLMPGLPRPPSSPA